MSDLPENFVYHSDCMLSWTEFLSVDEIIEVERYAEVHFQELADAIIARNPQTTFSPEELDMYAEEDAFAKVFPVKAEEKESLEKNLALEAYNRRGAGDCGECVHEALDEPWKAVE
jgi:hypothetical protein